MTGTFLPVYLILRNRRFRIITMTSPLADFSIIEGKYNLLSFTSTYRIKLCSYNVERFKLSYMYTITSFRIHTCMMFTVSIRRKHFLWTNFLYHSQVWKSLTKRESLPRRLLSHLTFRLFNMRVMTTNVNVKDEFKTKQVSDYVK